MTKTFAIINLAILLTTSCATTKQKPRQHLHQQPESSSSGPILNCTGPNGHHIYAEQLTCPLGGEKFTALRLGTHSTFGIHLDWEPQSYLHFPVAIPICPSNGFIVDKEDLTLDELEKRKTFIESEDYQQLYKQKHASFFLYGKLVEALNTENKNELWWYYLEATWEANNCGNIQRYTEYASLVISEGLKRKAALTVSDEEFWVISIVVPEMYRRIGNFTAAKQELSKLPKPQLDDPEQNNFYNKAKSTLLKAINEKNIKQLPIEIKEE